MQGFQQPIDRIKNIKTKDVAGYVLMPRVVPRIKDFLESGFGWIAGLMAIIYASVRLLPPDHPYLNPANKGRFGIRHVIAEAANRLVLRRENTDQILIFLALLLGFVLLVLQVGAIVFGFIVQPALATSAAEFAGLFSTPNPENDIAFMLLDKVFAVPDLFGSAFAPTGPGDIPGFNKGLQELFKYYNMMILIVGVFIFLYYVLIVVGETAQTGSPFGKRFNHIWAPMRLVAAVGLLVPLNYGYNSAQYITLYAAKMGSSFATNGWILFNRTLSNGMGHENSTLIGKPKGGDIDHIVSFMSIVGACREGYLQSTKDLAGGKIEILPYFVNGNNTQDVSSFPAYADALAFYNNGDIHIVFGHQNNAYNEHPGKIKPLCGKITIHTNSVDKATNAGAYTIQDWHYSTVAGLWVDASAGSDLYALAQTATRAWLTKDRQDPCEVNPDPGPSCRDLPKAEFKKRVTTFWEDPFKSAILDGVAAQRANTDFTVPQELINRGWAGAGIWYNRIAQWNGPLFAAAVNVPTPSAVPMVMATAEQQRKKSDENVDARHRFEPYLKNGEAVKYGTEYELDIAVMLNRLYLYWMNSASTNATDTQVSGNVIFDVLNAMFGTNGLFDMRTNVEVHPLAQLVGLGKSILESAIRNLMTSLAFSFLGGMGEIANPHLGGALHSMSSIMVSLSTLGITMGFLLYYVLPFMPFMYFFFAVGKWVKGVFEAMVGAPLWALAHLKIDGDGFSGDHATNGYFMIFEIFIRPILCVFGLLAGLAVFAGMARVLNDIFDLVVFNLAGFDCADCKGGTPTLAQSFKRNIIDEFFYTVVYAILVYMLALSSFKLVDKIPESIMRWMGAGVHAFSDHSSDMTENLKEYIAVSAPKITQNVVGIANQASRGAGQALGYVLYGRNAKDNTQIAGTPGTGAQAQRPTKAPGITATKPADGS